MKLALPERLAARLFDEPAERERFVAALAEGLSAYPVEVTRGQESGERDLRLPAWVPDFVRGRSGEETSYGLDLSSVWEMRPLASLGPVRRLLDLCAAPGGKSVLASRWLSPEFHLANEVVPKRLGILRHNLARCGVSAFTQRMEPAKLAERAAGAFDLVLVDAPCSGQSLVARGVENPGCFHPSTMKGNAMRQRGILSSAAACVAPGGWLLYSTCTFAPDENGKNMVWFGRRFPEFREQEPAAMSPWRGSQAPGYTLFPHQGIGSGGFCCLWRRDGATAELPALDPDLGAFPVAPA